MGWKKFLRKFKCSRKSSSKAQSDQPTTLHPLSTTTNVHTPPPSTTKLQAPSSTTKLQAPTTTTPTSSSTARAHIVANAPAEPSTKPTTSASSTTSPPMNASPTRTLLDAFQFSVTILSNAPLPGVKLAANAVLELLRRIQVGHETTPAVRFCWPPVMM